MPTQTLVIRRQGERHRVGRTVRALAAAGVGAEDAGIDLAEAIARIRGPVWLVHAGAWPTHQGKITFPPPSATGKPLVAIGAVHAEPGFSLNGPSSLYLEAEPANTLAR